MARLILTGRKRDLMGARPMKVVDDLGGAITTKNRAESIWYIDVP